MPGVPYPKLIQPGTAGRTQENVDAALQKVANDNPVAGAAHLTGLKVSATALKVAHKLGRKWTGWIITSNLTPTAVTAAHGSDDATFITLVCTGANTIDILVF